MNVNIIVFSLSVVGPRGVLIHWVAPKYFTCCAAKDIEIF
jgi:hypothetical protein